MQSQGTASLNDLHVGLSKQQNEYLKFIKAHNCYLKVKDNRIKQKKLLTQEVFIRNFACNRNQH